MRFDTAVSGAVILSAHNGFIPFVGSVGVKDGRIVWVTSEKIQPSECDNWVDGSDRILMPGLVNAHCHGDMTLGRGLGDDLTLQEQNERFADTCWFYTLIDDEDRIASRQLTYCEALLSGTTFLMENMYWSLGEHSAEAMDQVGIRGALAEDVRPNFLEPDVMLDEAAVQKFQAGCRNRDLTPVLGTLSEEDFSTERLKRIRRLCERTGIRQTYHLAETAWREQIVQDRYGTTSITYLNEIGYLNRQQLASHVVWLNEAEIQMLADSGVSVANTPLCEMKIADGIAPIPEMVRRGVNVCLGSDGAMWNNSNDIFREMKGMALLHTIHGGIRSLTVQDILRMATVQGAKAFGLENDFGTIEEGRSADFILLRTDVPHMQPLRIGLCENVASSVVFSATGNDVSDVFVKGKQLVKDRKLQTVDVSEIISRVNKTSDRIARKISTQQKPQKN